MKLTYQKVNEIRNDSLTLYLPLNLVKSVYLAQPYSRRRNPSYPRRRHHPNLQPFTDKLTRSKTIRSLYTCHSIWSHPFTKPKLIRDAEQTLEGHSR
ncbi:hypothetical protein PGTUg99_014642 [Puccinia graminis f. sp. tritici]|uniref:Uncharacterized protein n=1 Tax=Puccinia graminis f. sp. tritici TaxID=56615 RepID=A0A5B0PDJ6_PUCGR|nr:hypothetical protein PGTUg99_014642 [Puccinia graminis f. sp. tritici]